VLAAFFGHRVAWSIPSRPLQQPQRTQAFLRKQAALYAWEREQLGLPELPTGRPFLPRAELIAPDDLVPDGAPASAPADYLPGSSPEDRPQP
jgi:hypothetical protein